MPGIEFGRFAPTGDVPEGAMLLASGSLTATISSRATGAHVTVRLRCTRRDPAGPMRWPTVPFKDATHVFVDDFDGEEIAAYDPKHGMIHWARGATQAARWTVGALLRYLAGDLRLLDQAELASMSHCLKCGRELTDPESIERGYGPDCWGEVTRSKPVRTVG